MKGDTILILALVLSILLVMVYAGSSVVGFFGGFGDGGTIEGMSAWWVRNINDPLSNFKTNYTSNWSGSVGKIKDLFGMNKEMSIEPFLKTIYENDVFIFTAKNTNNEYLGLLSEGLETTRFYTIVSFPEIKLEMDRSAITNYLKSEGIEDFYAEEYKELLIPDALMKDIEDIDHFKENKRLHIHSALHDAHLDFMKIVETGTAYQPVIYQLTIAIKEK
jgi:hypothetical protein